MTCFETDLPPFDPALQPIGFALASELSHAEPTDIADDAESPERTADAPPAAGKVVVPFTTSADNSTTTVNWFEPARSPGNGSECRRAAPADPIEGMTPEHQHWWARPDPAGLPGTTVPAQISAFHRSMPGYGVTPLVEMPAVARSTRLGKVLVKDESQRLGLPAFKMLGASWAIARLVARQAGVRPPSTFAELKQLAAGAQLTLLAATAGNHGRAVARVAGLLGVAAKVWIPAASPAALADAISREGAEVTVIDDDYDEALRLASKAIELHPSAALLQDTAWDGYEDVPGWVVEGYSTLFGELTEPADVLVVPAGVGSLLQAAVTYRAPSTAVLAVESAAAACISASLRAGEPRRVSTGTTVMAGLNAGTISTIAWPVLRDGVTAAVTVDDAAALAAAEVLDGGGVPAGPCGGGALAGLLAAAEVPELRTALRLDERSTVVVLSTDGRTS